MHNDNMIIAQIIVGEQLTCKIVRGAKRWCDTPIERLQWALEVPGMKPYRSVGIVVFTNTFACQVISIFCGSGSALGYFYHYFGVHQNKQAHCATSGSWCTGYKLIRVERFLTPVTTTSSR